MNELVVADVNSDVRQTPGVGVLEENQITWPQIAVGDAHTIAELRRYRSSDVDAERVPDYPVSKTGAVKRSWSRGRPDIWVAEVLHRKVDDA